MDAMARVTMKDAAKCVKLLRIADIREKKQLLNAVCVV